jgi:hypothetical protein
MTDPAVIATYKATGSFFLRFVDFGLMPPFPVARHQLI